jgi:capsular polysaccharide biosynthesis protein
LQYRGFVVVEPSEMSVEQQAECFRSADVIVAPHGAALTNLAFARRGTKIIEIFDPRFVNGCYALLSYVRDLDYHFVFGQRCHESGQDHFDDLGLRAQPPAPMVAIPSWENFNITADLSSLEETLDHAGL